MDKTIKRISVVVPNYNYGKYIQKRIESILNQTYPIYELIILDDASTDKSADIIKKIVLDSKLKNPGLNIRFIENKVNSGKAVAQWKKGFELAMGDYIWIAEADDLSNRKFLEEAMKGFNDPDVVLSYTESRVINGLGVMIVPNLRWSRDKEKTGHYKNNFVRSGVDEIEEIMAIRCTIPNVSAVVFKNDKKFLRYLDEALKFSQVGDWYFYVKALENGKISYNRKPLNFFRIHRGSKTDKSKGDKKHFNEILEMHKYFDQKYRLTDTIKRNMIREVSRVKVKHGIMD